MTVLRKATRAIVRCSVLASAILWTASVCVWIVSYRSFVLIGVAIPPSGSPYTELALVAEHGGIAGVLSRERSARSWSYIEVDHRPAAMYAGGGWRMGRFGFDFGIERFLTSVQCGGVAPGWFWCIITGIVPLAWLLAKPFRARPVDGCCQKCGYDLRASPVRCPECGTPVMRNRTTERTKFRRFLN
jgi:hypothetical protein